MSDLRYDGIRLWAKVRWRFKGGPDIDANKIMLVDTGAPSSTISYSNIPPGLTLIGLSATIIGGTSGEVLILDGGEMVMTVNGVEKSCSFPVKYNPRFNIDILGMDQVFTLGLIPGLMGGPPTPLPYIPLGPFTVFPGLLDIFGTPTSAGITPLPGTFLELPVQGTADTPQWKFEQRWPGMIPPGVTFPLMINVVLKKAVTSLTIAFEIPGGFKIAQGNATNTMNSLHVGDPVCIPLQLVASPNTGDHFWKTIIRSTTVKGETTQTEVAGRIIVGNSSYGV